MRLLKNKKGLSLVETLIAVGIFALAASVASGMLFETVKSSKRTELQNTLYEDARLILQQITNEIQRGTIDYDEYYSVKVLEAPYFGMYHGVYGSRFYDPGDADATGVKGSNPKNLGTFCSYPEDASADDCQVVLTSSTDLNMGQNPWNADTDAAKATANAFCDVNSTCSETSIEAEQLYLIDSTGTRKTIIGKRLSGGAADEGYVLSLVRMKGYDLDQNGVVDTFGCEEGYNCVAVGGNNIPEADFKWLPADERSDLLSTYGISLPSKAELFDGTVDPSVVGAFFTPNPAFLPFTPMNVNIQELKFIISPVEDPYKAFAEPAVQVHPSVTIIMTVGLAGSAAEEYPGTLDPITIQTTVAAGVMGGIPTYPPTSDLEWIDDTDVPAVDSSSP